MATLTLINPQPGLQQRKRPFMTSKLPAGDQEQHEGRSLAEDHRPRAASDARAQLGRWFFVPIVFACDVVVAVLAWIIAGLFVR